MIESFNVFKDLIGQRKIFLCNILQSPKLHLIIGIHSGRFIEEILLRWRHSTSQPSLMNYGWYNRLRRFLSKRSKGKTLVEDYQFFKWDLVSDQVLEIAVHTFNLDPSKGLFKLLKINFIDLLRHYESILNKNGLPRNVELVRIFSDYVKFLSLCYVVSYQVKHGH